MREGVVSVHEVRIEWGTGYIDQIRFEVFPSELCQLLREASDFHFKLRIDSRKFPFFSVKVTIRHVNS